MGEDGQDFELSWQQYSSWEQQQPLGGLIVVVVVVCEE
jgi:hypothetical protein